MNLALKELTSKKLEKFDGKPPWDRRQNGHQIGKNYAYCKEIALVLIFHFRKIFSRLENSRFEKVAFLKKKVLLTIAFVKK